MGGAPESSAINTFIVATVSILIALVTALRNFFRWQENWQLFSSQQLAVEALVREWKFEMVKLIEEGADNASSRAIETGTFLKRFDESLRSEHDTFADTVSRPEVPRLGQTSAASAE